MNEYNPGDGWREVERPEAAMHGEALTYRAPHGENPRVRTWVRVEPVPPLPDAPYTVIRVTWKPDTHWAKRSTNPVLMRFPEGWYGEWGWSDGDDFGAADDLAKVITGFKVLAEPRKTDLAEFTSDPLGVVRRQTAKAILDRVRQVRGIPWGLLDVLDDVAREFGVES